jgi:predicted nucleic acid-binding protein
VTLSEELARFETVFFDTAPIIYYIEAHPRFGPLAKEAVEAFQKGTVTAYSSVITLAEVLAKPVQLGRLALAKQFADFLLTGRNFYMLEIDAEMANRAGWLRGKHAALRTVDSIQIAAALTIGADAFLTNDDRLKRVGEIKVLVLKDCL